MGERFEAVVIGAGPAGEVAASRLNQQGLRTALIERELVGGECAYWACIPSKTLLRPPEVRFEAKRTAGTSAPEQRWAEISDYRDYMIRHLDDTAQVGGYEKSGVRVYKGEGKLAGHGGSSCTSAWPRARSARARASAASGSVTAPWSAGRSC